MAASSSGRHADDSASAVRGLSAAHARFLRAPRPPRAARASALSSPPLPSSARAPRRCAMVQKLRHRDLDGEVERVATTARQLQRPRRELRAGSAATAVLLARVLLEHEHASHHVDLFGLLVLSVPLDHLTPARCTTALARTELMHVLFERQLALLARPARWLRFHGCSIGVARPLLARGGEHAALQRHHLLLHAQQLEFELLRCTLSA